MQRRSFGAAFYFMTEADAIIEQLTLLNALMMKLVDIADKWYLLELSEHETKVKPNFILGTKNHS